MSVAFPIPGNLAVGTSSAGVVTRTGDWSEMGLAVVCTHLCSQQRPGGCPAFPFSWGFSWTRGTPPCHTSDRLLCSPGPQSASLHAPFSSFPTFAPVMIRTLPTVAPRAVQGWQGNRHCTAGAEKVLCALKQRLAKPDLQAGTTRGYLEFGCPSD